MKNINELINNLGGTYQQIFEMGLIPYVTKPIQSIGDDYAFLKIMKEGVSFSFNASDKKFYEMTVTVRDETRPKFINPNRLPAPFNPDLTREKGLTLFGQPVKTYKPEKIASQQFGFQDVYYLPGSQQQIGVSVLYTVTENRLQNTTYFLVKYRPRIFE